MEKTIILKDRTVKRTANSIEHTIPKIKLDLSDRTEGEYDEYAARGIWIACQSQLRKLSEKELDELESVGTYTWKVPKPGSRITEAPEEKLKREMEGMTPAEKVEYLKSKGLWVDLT
jgi:hypothetical protein